MTLPRRPLLLTAPEQTPGLAGPLEGVDYLEALAALHASRGPGRYLEIGVAAGHTLALARGAAIGIDPAFVIDQPIWRNKSALHLFEDHSDRFFRRHHPPTLLGGPIDIAFIDGMHHAEYALRDLINIERHIAPGGVILMHDVLPWDYGATRRLMRQGDGFEPVIGGWTGDVWKVLALLQEARPELVITLLDCPPTGLALISNLDPASETLWERYGALVGRALRPLHSEVAFRGWLEKLEVTDSRAWVEAGCPIPTPGGET